MKAAHVLARRYAIAFLNVFQDTISFDDFMHIKATLPFFSKRKKILYFLSLPAIRAETRLATMDHLFKQLKLLPSLAALMLLLVHDKRAGLLYNVLVYVVQLYEQRNHIMDFLVESSHELNKQQLKTIEQFLAQQTRNDIIYKYHINDELIAGIRLQSSTLLWEYSVAKKLRIISLSLIR